MKPWGRRILLLLVLALALCAATTALGEERLAAAQSAAGKGAPKGGYELKRGKTVKFWLFQEDDGTYLRREDGRAYEGVRFTSYGTVKAKVLSGGKYLSVTREANGLFRWTIKNNKTLARREMRLRFSDDKGLLGTVIFYQIGSPRITKIGLAADKYVSLAWSKAASSAKTAIYRAAEGETTAKLVRLTSAASWTDKTVQPGLKYYYYAVPCLKAGGEDRLGYPSARRSVRLPEIVRHRALLIGEAGYAPVCERNWNDVLATKAILEKRYAGGQKYKTVALKDQTAAQIQSAIATAFAGANEDSTSFFFFAGHGYVASSGPYAGALSCYDGSHVTLEELASWLARVPGKVVVMLGSCGSGSAVYENGARAFNETAAFNAAVVAAFRAVDQVARTGEFLSNKFCVLTAAAHAESSWGYEPQGNLFTTWFGEAVGYDRASGAWSNMAGDINGDKMLSLDEAFRYIESRAATREGKYRQHTQVYPPNSPYVLLTVDP